jgi:PKD repeat protein
MMRTRAAALSASLAVVLATFAVLIVGGPQANAVVDPSVTKVLTFVEENHSLAQMEAGMPYAWGLAQQYGYANNWTAITHPSLPNYIAIASGKTYGIVDDKPPSSHKLAGPSIFGQTVTAGKTAKLYAEGETKNCMQTNTGQYAVKHNPWAYFVDSTERTPCNTNDVPTTKLDADITAGTLPVTGMVVPNLLNDGHDGTLLAADNWFKAWMLKIFAGPDWASGRLAVVLTADEDDKLSGNKVLTVVIHPALSGKVVSTPLTHYSLTRFYEDVAGTTRLNGAATAPDMATAFGLYPGIAPPPNQPPVAAFTSACTNLDCTFNGSGSSDPDGTISSYAWTFGDGSTGTGVSPSHTYAAAGTYTVQLTVTDNAGATGTVSHDVTVTAPPVNQPPTAAFTSSCTDLNCSFDGSGSSDPDGTISSYAWDFGDAATGSGVSPAHTYAAAGTYTVGLTVTDNNGATGTVSHDVTVTSAPPANQPPVAAFTSSCTNLSCTFDASGSSDPDGTITSYGWNFGDSSTDSGVSPSHTYAAAGTYPVSLTVTDDDSATNSVTHDVTVTAPPPPVVSYYVDCAGSDSNNGLSSSTPWRTLAKANLAALQPGESLLLKRDCTWNEQLVAGWTGTSTNPVLIGAYGTGSDPLIQRDAQGTSTSMSDVSVSGSYQTIEHLRVKIVNPRLDSACLQTDGSAMPHGFYAGVSLGDTSSYDTVRYIDASSLSVGITMSDLTDHNTVSDNYLHDLHWLWGLAKESGGAIGSVGINLHGNDSEFTRNLAERNLGYCTYSDGTISRYSTPFEVYNANRNYVHHNRAFGHRKNFEMGHDSTHTTDDNVYAYNLVVSDAADAIGVNIHGTGNSFGPVNRTQIYNNTIVLTGANSQALVCSSTPGGTTVIDNILVAEWKAAYYSGPIVENHNVYWDYQQTVDSTADPFVQFNATTPQTSMDPTSKKLNPLFVDRLTDWHLQAGSPAASGGAVISTSDQKLAAILAYDLDGRTSAQNIGAYVLVAASPLGADILPAELTRTEPILHWIGRQVYVDQTPASFSAVPGVDQIQAMGLTGIISVDHPAVGSAGDAAMSAFAATVPAGWRIQLSNEPDNDPTHYTGPTWVAMVNELAPVIQAANSGVIVASGALMRATLLTNTSYWSGLNWTAIDEFAFHAYAHSFNPDGTPHAGWPYTFAKLVNDPTNSAVGHVRTSGWTGPMLLDEFAVEYDPNQSALDRAQWTYTGLKDSKALGIVTDYYWQHDIDPGSNSGYRWLLFDPDLSELQSLIDANQ